MQGRQCKAMQNKAKHGERKARRTESKAKIEAKLSKDKQRRAKQGKANQSCRYPQLKPIAPWHAFYDPLVDVRSKANKQTKKQSNAEKSKAKQSKAFFETGLH